MISRMVSGVREPMVVGARAGEGGDVADELRDVGGLLLGHRHQIRQRRDLALLDQLSQADAVVGNDQRFLDSCLNKIVNYIRRDREVELVDYDIDFR